MITIWIITIFLFLFEFRVFSCHALPSDRFLDKEVEHTLNTLIKSSSKYKNLPPLESNPKSKSKTIIPGSIPEYVSWYAPLVFLYSEERYLPYDIEEYVSHFRPTWRNGTLIDLPGKDPKDPYYTKQKLHLSDLEHLPQSTHDELVFLSSLSDFDTDPEWITGKHNKPNYYNGEIKNAPATLIVTDKGNGWVDAYWFYFYSFNLGPFVMGFGPFGNHVGDWEHSLVRFYNGEPVIVWMSAHGGGGAYFYDHMERESLNSTGIAIGNGDQPVIFSARGTHANYPSTGQHSHDIPYAILSDFTDRGGLWNPAKNYLAYTYTPSDENHKNMELVIANGSHPFREAKYGKWLEYNGAWGDPKLDPEDPRQHWSPFEWKYIDGPSGPLTKNLLRTSPCQRAKWWNFWNGCNVRRYVQYGQGMFDQEGNNSCGNFYAYFQNRWIRKVIETLSWGGWICFIIDIFYG
ncbi:Vacuolar protein sorting-associated protein 62 [Pichia californica]|uniref:Vacuolar protein sorting-associated protein 62 n=1 Tax=Pichia californica TaxID=460514 RepID=A0A9P6WNH2_9ASCO|nr:Vacuolar protein sorting-associated protein 62 [[Candida] californica]KAG0690342.1 Vacuolar protein sorting-associated protein 62 [[Candida] californica]